MYYNKDVNEFPPASDALAGDDTAEETTEKEIKINKYKGKIYTAKVITKNKAGVYGIDFKGFGISLETDKDLSVGQEIEVEYKSDIGKADFEYKLVQS